MRKFENIIQSDTAPQTNSLWLRNGILYVFTNGKWVEMEHSGNNNSGNSPGDSCDCEDHEYFNKDDANSLFNNIYS